MKKYGIIFGVVFLVSLFPVRQADAQEKKSQEREKELQELINEQKRAMIEQRKAAKESQEELKKAIIMNKDSFNIYDLIKAQEKIDSLNGPEFQRAMRDAQEQAWKRPFIQPQPFIYNPGWDQFNDNFSNGNSERTTWDFSKSIRESSFSRDYIFDVEPTAKSVVMSVSGDCKEGEIRIKIIMPNGKVFSEIVIDELGNMNWRKSLTISEDENRDKTGPWKFDIKSSKATGYFKIFFQTS